MSKEKDINILRHSAAHLFAHAIQSFIQKQNSPSDLLPMKVFFMTFYQQQTLKKKIYL